MPRNVVIHEDMGDPAGYSIAYDDERWFLVIRVTDGARIGRFESRVQALTAAEEDRVRPPGQPGEPPDPGGRAGRLRRST